MVGNKIIRYFNKRNILKTLLFTILSNGITKSSIFEMKHLILIVILVAVQTVNRNNLIKLQFYQKIEIFIYFFLLRFIQKLYQPQMLSRIFVMVLIHLAWAHMKHPRMLVTLFDQVQAHSHQVQIIVPQTSVAP